MPLSSAQVEVLYTCLSKTVPRVIQHLFWFCLYTLNVFLKITFMRIENHDEKESTITPTQAHYNFHKKFSPVHLLDI